MAAARAFPVETSIIDGEVVILDRDGRSNFQRLQHAISSGGAASFCFQAFDLIYLDGLDLTRVTLEDRKRLLRTLFNSIPVSSPLRYSDHIEGNGALFFQRACQTGVEGIVSKLRTSHYDSARSRTWLKVKCSKRQEFVIAGYTDSSKGLPGFGALILGVYDEGRLVYAGRVGTGFTIKQRIDLKHRLDRFARETPAFTVRPKDPGLREAHWLEPSLIAEVSFIEWTSDGSIRHPSFQGLREDKQPQEVRRSCPFFFSDRTRPQTRMVRRQEAEAEIAVLLRSQGWHSGRRLNSPPALQLREARNLPRDGGLVDLYARDSSGEDLINWILRYF